MPTPRRLALPLVVLASPPLFLLYREATLCGTSHGCRPLALAGYVTLSLAASVAALLLVQAGTAGWLPPGVAPRPDDRTLAALAALVTVFAAFLLAAAAGLVPPWLGGALAPIGVLLAFPGVVVHGLLVGAGNAVGAPAAPVRLLAVAGGVALTGAWWYVLAASAAEWLARVNEPRD